MSDLKMLDPILSKLSGMNVKLDELYQIVDDIKKLKFDINSIFTESKDKSKSFQTTSADLLRRYEEYFRGADVKLNQLNSDFSEKLKVLEKNKEEVDLILEIYQEQQEKIDSALTFLNIQKVSSELLKQQLVQAFDGLDNNIKNKLNEFKIALKSEVSSFYPEAEQKIENALNQILAEQESLKSFAEEIKESLIAFNLEKSKLVSDISQVKDKTKSEIYDFKNKIEQDLFTFKEAKNQEINQKIQIIEESGNRRIDDRLDKIAEEQSIFLERQNRIIQQQKTLIDDLSSQLDTLQRISEKDRGEKTETIDKLNYYIQENIESKIKDCEKQIIRTEIKVNEVNEKIEKISEKPTKKGFFG